MEDLRQEEAGPHPDVNVQETHNLSAGLPATEWVFWVSPNATGHVVLRIVDLVTGEHAALPSACVEWDRQTSTSASSGESGSCEAGNSAIVIQGGDLEGKTVLSWDNLAQGKYTIRASAQPQGNQLIVDFFIDNP